MNIEEKVKVIVLAQKMIKIVFGWQEGSGERIGLETHFGKGFNFIIWTDHLDFF